VTEPRSVPSAVGTTTTATSSRSSAIGKRLRERRVVDRERADPADRRHREAAVRVGRRLGDLHPLRLAADGVGRHVPRDGGTEEGDRPLAARLPVGVEQAAAARDDRRERLAPQPAFGARLELDRPAVEPRMVAVLRGPAERSGRQRPDRRADVARRVEAAGGRRDRARRRS
jgi:hypothetical protein